MPEGHPGYIVVLNDNFARSSKVDVREAVKTYAEKHGLKARQVYTHVFKGFSVTDEISVARLDALSKNQSVAYLDPIRIFDLHMLGRTNGVNRIDAELNAEAQINDISDHNVGVNIAIIDTEADSTHGNLNLTSGRVKDFGSIARCGINGSSGFSQVYHGSHVSGIAAAYDDGTGVVG